MYEANIAPFPFWGDVTSSKMGRDPLAIQNSSVVIYSNMISGITNVTGRVRYNGFYCWLLTFIAERLFLTNKEQVDNPKLQIKYLRRAELLLAYSMIENYPNVLGVNGSTYAQKHINTAVLDLERGADLGNKSDVYWKNSYGIFGQYYMGVLSQLRLIYMPDFRHKTYRVTESGRRLCNIFRKSLNGDSEDAFWNAISSGRITKDKLHLFKDISLHLIENEDELLEYTNIFCGYDFKDVAGNEVYHRLNSMKLLLRYIRNKGTVVDRKNLVLSFLKYNFLNALERQLDISDEELSWFLYELNELTHAAYEAFHFAILYSISEEPQPLETILEMLKRKHNKYLNEENNTEDIYELYNKLRTYYKNKNYGALICEASRLFFVLYKTVNSHIPRLFAYANEADYDIKHPGFAPLLLQRLVSENNIQCDWDFAENCIYNAINDHLKSSYSKSSIGQGIVHNYMIEDGLIWQLRRPDPIRTSPRLQNVLQYIEDMKWIKREGDFYKITERGFKIIMK